MTDDLDTGIDVVTSEPTRKMGFTVLLLECFAGLVAIAIVVALFMPAVRRAGPAARSSQCKNNLKQIGLALHNYREFYKAFPPAYTVDAKGNPLHSWRTLILPYLDHATLYGTIDLSKPWNDPANAHAYETLQVPRCPEATCAMNYTTYLAVVTPKSCFRPKESARFSEITDGLSNTLSVIEVDLEHAVHWMSPLDADEQMVLAIGIDSKTPHSSGMHGLFLDGTPRLIQVKMAHEERLALISIAGKD
jgi:hypothetical protein